MRAKGWRVALVLGVAGWCGGCDEYPQDPLGTLARVEGGTLRIGVAGAGPDRLSVAEEELVAALATDLGARIERVQDATGHLMRGLDAGRVDIVIGGIARSDPWSSRVAISRPYAHTVSPEGRRLRLVIAAPRGENAFLLRIDRVIARRGDADAP